MCEQGEVWTLRQDYYTVTPECPNVLLVDDGGSLSDDGTVKGHRQV